MHLDGRKLYLICDLTLSWKKAKKDIDGVMKIPALKNTDPIGKVKMRIMWVSLYRTLTVLALA